VSRLLWLCSLLPAVLHRNGTYGMIGTENSIERWQHCILQPMCWKVHSSVLAVDDRMHVTTFR
jgi:hypothetical protein